MKKIIVLILISIGFGFAIFEDLESSTRAEGMASAFTAVSDDPSAMQFNPAGLMQINNLSLMAFYKLLYGRVGVNLRHICFNGVYPLNNRAGVIGIGLQQMGISLHSEKVFTISHSLNLIKDILFGYNIRTYQLSQTDYGSDLAFGLDLGVLTKIYKRWQYGFYIRNINSPTMGSDVKYNLPRILNVGVAYRPTTGIISTMDISKEVGKPTRIAVGQELEIIENYLTLRAGIQTEPIRFGFGLRTGIKNIYIDYALTTHSELPLTHNFGILINLDKTIKKVKPVEKPVSTTQTEKSEKETDLSVFKLSPIYFDYDKSDIRPTDAEILKSNATILISNPNIKISIEGHCDPMGTSEYNIALGWRRANSTQEYLVKLGIDKQRMGVISYGEERLITNNENEYWKNRRCEFVIKK